VITTSQICTHLPCHQRGGGAHKISIAKISSTDVQSKVIILDFQEKRIFGFSLSLKDFIRLDHICPLHATRRSYFKAGAALDMKHLFMKELFWTTFVKSFVPSVCLFGLRAGILSITDSPEQLSRE
jgi:hypothetical protein